MAKVKLAYFLTLINLLTMTATPNISAHEGLSVNNLQLSAYPEYYFAPYRVSGERPADFEDVTCFTLSGERHPELISHEQEGNALVNGRLDTADGAKYKFTTAMLVRSTTLLREGRGLFNKLIFTTESVEGISYSFEGQFLPHPEEVKLGVYTDLKGVLTKFKTGQKVAEAELGFTLLRKE